MPEELGAQADIDPIRRMRKHIDPKPAYNRFENCQRDHSDRQHMERRESLVYEYFVDDDLCKERRQQGEELKKERRNQHFAEKLTIFDNGRDEPGEVEREILRTDSGSFGKEQQFPGPCRFELPTREDERPCFDRILDQDLLFFHLR
jgi:hypothetical protein